MHRYLPQAATPTLLTLTASDALTLARLPAGPEADVTLVLSGRRARVRTAGADEVRLTRATVSGPPLVARMAREHLDRALALGFRTFRFARPDQPVVAVDGDRTYLASLLDPAPDSPETAPVKLSPPAPPPPPATEPDDPLVLAEAIRTALAEASQAAARLVTRLKARRKSDRTLTQVWTSLQSLHLGPREKP